MSVLPIVTYDDDLLRQKAEKVKENSESFQQLIDDMFDTMYNSDGVGLAGPQVGKLKRLFVMDADPMAKEFDEPKQGPLVMINPEIIEAGEQEIQLDEGCLSIPDVNAPVKRPEDIVVEYLDRDFNKQRLEASGWLSRVIQHENDHLDGILFLDYLSVFKRKLFGSKLKSIASGDKEIDYPTVPKKAQV
ncbi:peptide deformylase [Fodinibius salsisoli]|uniref:Peptide deformylase n=1 Tax=Fodinibius salsisoli TaxID=2820877 RepID=A0ABT3PQ64_9BACT|nr:peptide deformylase [Fodinibius salsisoli]MCW9708002.1 peptide deformylase [Fodinibius salsisoli]